MGLDSVTRQSLECVSQMQEQQAKQIKRKNVYDTTKKLNVCFHLTESFHGCLNVNKRAERTKRKQDERITTGKEGG